MLHSFAGADGAVPYYGRLLIDANGTLYGVTSSGGASNQGVLYKLTRKGIKVLHSFAGRSRDGCYPYGTPATDGCGNFFGATAACGSSNHGTVWTVSEQGAESVLHNFAGGTRDGCNPLAGVIRDSEGNLYGSALSCGANGYGTVWRLRKGTLVTLHSFDALTVYPYGDLIRDAKGGLYGTTEGYGFYDYGTVWSLTP